MYDYTFQSWSGYTEGMVADQDYIFTAIFRSTLRKFTIRVYYNDGTSRFERGTKTYGTPYTQLFRRTMALFRTVLYTLEPILRPRRIVVPGSAPAVFSRP